MTGSYFSPGMAVQENKPGLSLISAFSDKCQNTLSRSKKKIFAFHCGFGSLAGQRTIKP
jgi:hypothetical protein